MQRKLDLHAFNMFLVITFALVFASVLILDLVRFWIENPLGVLVAWRLDQNVVNWTDDGPAKLFAMFVSSIAAGGFFITGRRYNVIREQKKDKQLATQVYLSLIYTGIARLFEAFFIISDSSLRGIVFSVGKFYIVLDMLGIVMFVLVSAEVFLQTDVHAGSKFPTFLHRLLLASIVIALGALFLEYAPAEIERILDWIVVGASIIVFLIVATILIATCTKIIHLYMRHPENEDRGALLVIGLQLILLIVSMFSLIYLEIGAGDAADYFLRGGRCGLLLVFALLYFPAFINPSLKKKHEIDKETNMK
ncbi:MAG: hypothetical protein GYA24_05140 [Candidatus Lokiarchaeota archaeon]|nr:hypothetical protein [Candidatus Lokiarchaeota archaeon]